MESLKKYLNYIALALIFLAIASSRIWPYKKPQFYILLILGIGALIVYIWFNLSELQQGIKRKSFLYSSNLILIVVLVLGILFLVNYIFSKYHYRFDFTEAKVHSLSDQSVTVLKNLKAEVRIKSFFLEGNYGQNRMENLLKIYAYHSPKIKYEFIDPDKNPGLVKRYEVTEDGTSILEYGDKESRITTSSEEDITNAIIKVTRERKKLIYWLEGHGEASIEDTEEGGYSQAKSELEKLAYEIKKLNVALPDTFPKDADCLIIPGPVKDLFPDELETVSKYLHQGGKVFLMVDPEAAPGMKAYLADFGIKLEDDLIVDTVSRLMGGDYFMPVVSEYEYHDITNKFRYATFYPYARSVDKTENAVEGVTTEILAKTSQNSWSERQLKEQQVTFNEGTDEAGPIPLAVVATIDTKADEPESTPAEPKETEEEKETEEAGDKPKSEGRLAVFGDSDFVTNRYYYLSGNGNFFLNTVNWLTEESDLISIQPKTSSPKTIQLTPSQGRMIFWVSLIILPLVVLVTGISVWFRRKSR
ncbi:MAG: Gldg family protein [Candidatus Aminicenantes bacterium]|nr:Gldg family protein [Candidatus Aminicenantes bacterium]